TEMKPGAQVRLLRVLSQDGEYERVGGTETLQANVRVVAATNRDIEGEVKQGRFREDLYYRLNVIPLPVPPLRERVSDITLLAQHFLVRFSKKNGKSLEGFTPDALDAMSSYAWPGNVRELENAIERAVVLCRSDRIGVTDLPRGPREGATERKHLSFEVGTPLKKIERRMIEETLRYCSGDKSLAASLLGITARTIYRREAEWAEEEP
ncbi:MAG TPA: sigma-54-dependent Fis family transcriptional regulator, partial [Deltaproteobacteria bacterium]|nr:sigma-54-dependent Fis family transcriptional regulator [Deltaproteobacteria bacterium]